MISKIKQFPVVFHIGYHKTATTYLQHLVFPFQPGLLYPGRPFKNKKISAFFLENQFTHPLLFDPVQLQEKFYEAVSGWLQEAGERMEEKKALLISHESLHSGPEWFGMDVCMMADRLKAIFPNAKIIIGIRNQRDYIESNYKEYVIHGGKLDYRRFISDSYAFNYALQPKLHYGRLIRYYHQLFGKDNVHVYLLEDFKNNLDAELDSMMRFMNVVPAGSYRKDKVNVALSKTSTGFVRSLNCLLAKDFNEQYYNWMNQRISIREKFRWLIIRILRKAEGRNVLSRSTKLTDEKTNKRFIEMFTDTNRELSVLLNKDLSKLGYFI